MNQGQKRNHLTDQLKGKLLTWMNRNLTELNHNVKLAPDKETGVEMLAKAATMALGFPVSKVNVRSVIKNFGIKIDIPMKVTQGKFAVSTLILSDALVNLYHLAGEAAQTPQELIELQSKAREFLKSVGKVPGKEE